MLLLKGWASMSRRPVLQFSTRPQPCTLLLSILLISDSKYYPIKLLLLLLLPVSRPRHTTHTQKDTFPCRWHSRTARRSSVDSSTLVDDGKSRSVGAASGVCKCRAAGKQLLTRMHGNSNQPSCEPGPPSTTTLERAEVGTLRGQRGHPGQNEAHQSKQGGLRSWYQKLPIH